MFKKIIAKLRGKTTSTPQKPASSSEKKSSEKKDGRPARSRSGNKPSNGNRKPRGERSERSERGGPREGSARGGQQRRGGRNEHSESSRGGARGPQRERGRPARDDTFEHPRSEPVKPAVPVDVPAMDTPFSKLGLCDALAYGVQEKGYTQPTAIQAQSIPLILAGRDVIGSAQTGTGKTAAFALPIIQKLGGHGKLRCLVLEPTRELALQVEEAFQTYAKFTDLQITIIYGGVGYGKQLEDLKRGMDIIAATPGRLLDHLEQRNCSLADIDILVLDEVDRMLDMGFLPDVKRIVQQTPKSRQTLFFTATIPPEIAELAGWALNNPEKVEIGRQRAPAETVSHGFYQVVASQKFDLFELLLKQTDFKSVIVFTRTRMGADRIAQRLKRSGHTAAVMHSDRSQRERVEALQGFKSGEFEMLIATDIAARGLDIAGVSHVVNYDVPENAEDYVHRVGRTGRAQSTGDAFTLVTEDDVRNARSIERYMGVGVERKKIEGFEYIYSALFDENAQPAAPKKTSRLHRGVRR
jgi:ATP-dependent RNA helicase RhlE